MWYQCKMKDGSTRWMTQAVYQSSRDVVEVLQSTDRNPFERPSVSARPASQKDWDLPPYA